MNGTIFGKRLLNIKCVFLFSLQLLFEIILIIRIIQRDIVINVKTSSCRVAVFSTEFRRKLKYQISSKSVQGELSCFMRTDMQRDGQTYMTKLVVDFCNFSNAPKNAGCISRRIPVEEIETVIFSKHRQIFGRLFYWPPACSSIVFQ